MDGFRLMNVKSLFGRFSKDESDPLNDLRGDYLDWKSALAASSGYDDPRILERTVEAVNRVQSGEAAFERDSVTFNEIEYNWPFLAALAWAAARHRGDLNVLDFGGSLGSVYVQNRKFLQYIKMVRWNIVEQRSHVARGQELFADERLRFYPTIEDCTRDSSPTTVVLGGVLQYLEHPYLILRHLSMVQSIDTIIVDLTPFWAGPRDMLCVQHVPSWIYDASYPSWIFSRERFTENVEPGWTLLERFQAFDKLTGPVDLSFEGMILVRSQNSRG
jgi:putative methyltransferase (TIGR04325 family)